MLFNSSDDDRAHLIGYDKGHSHGYENGYADAYHETKSEYEEDIAELEKEVDRLIEAAAEVGAELEEVQRARSGDIGRMFGKYSEGYTEGYNAALKLDSAATSKKVEALKKSLSTTRWENADLKEKIKNLQKVDSIPEQYDAGFAAGVVTGKQQLEATITKLEAELAEKERFIDTLYRENKEEFNRGLRQGEWKAEYKHSQEKYGM